MTRPRLWLTSAIFLFLTATLCAPVLGAQEVLGNAVLARTDSAVRAVAWSPDGKYFATSWENSVILWDADTNTIVAVWSGHKAPVINAQFSADSQWFLSVGEDNSVIIRNIDEKISAIKVTGEGSHPIKDATFMANGYSIMTPVDGLNTTHCFRLVVTNQFIFRGVTTSVIPVTALDVNPTYTKLLITTEDGTVKLFSLEEGKELQSYPRYAASNIGAVFSPDGNYFLTAADKTSLVISPVDGPGAFVIRDSDMPVNSAVYSPDGTQVASALQNGMIKVYNVSDGSVAHAYSIQIENGDVAESVAFSPDGENLLAGTRRGYIFRWNVEGKEFVPVRKTYQNKDLEKLAEVYTDQTVVRDARTDEEERAVDIAKKKGLNTETPLNSIEINLNFNTLNSEHYYGAFGVGVGYRNYKPFPLYWGGGGEITAGVPDKDNPYQDRPEYLARYGDVWCYSAGAFLLAGLAYYNVGKSLLIFTEARAGVNAKILFNNNLNHYQISNPNVGGQFDVLTGIEWKFARITIGTEFDSNFNFMFKAAVGFVIHKKPKPVSAPDEEQNE